MRCEKSFYDKDWQYVQEKCDVYTVSNDTESSTDDEPWWSEESTTSTCGSNDECEYADCENGLYCLATICHNQCDESTCKMSFYDEGLNFIERDCDPADFAGGDNENEGTIIDYDWEWEEWMPV